MIINILVNTIQTIQKYPSTVYKVHYVFTRFQKKKKKNIINFQFQHIFQKNATKTVYWLLFFSAINWSFRKKKLQNWTAHLLKRKKKKRNKATNKWTIVNRRYIHRKWGTSFPFLIRETRGWPWLSDSSTVHYRNPDGIYTNQTRRIDACRGRYLPLVRITEALAKRINTLVARNGGSDGGILTRTDCAGNRARPPATLKPGAQRLRRSAGAWWIRMEGIPMEIIPPSFSLIPRLALASSLPCEARARDRESLNSVVRSHKGSNARRGTIEREEASSLSSGPLALSRNERKMWLQWRFAESCLSLLSGLFSVFHLVWSNWHAIISIHLACSSIFNLSRWNARRERFVPNCNIFSVLSIFKCNPDKTNGSLLLNNFYSVISYRQSWVKYYFKWQIINGYFILYHACMFENKISKIIYYENKIFYF